MVNRRVPKRKPRPPTRPRIGKPKPKTGRKPNTRDRFGQGTTNLGSGNDPTLGAKLTFGLGGGVSIDFKIVKEGDPGPKKIAAWVKGYSDPNEVLPSVPPNTAYSTGAAVALAPNVNTQYATFFSRIGTGHTWAWVFARVTLDDDSVVDYVRFWRLASSPEGYTSLPQI